MGNRNARNSDFGWFSLVLRVICTEFPYDFMFARIDLFTDTAAILNKVDLRSIMGCPGGA